MSSTPSIPSKRPATVAEGASFSSTTAATPVSPTFLPSLPTLDDNGDDAAAPVARAARSHLVLVGLVAAAVVSAWLLGFDLAQGEGEEGVAPAPAAAAAPGRSWLALPAWLASLVALLVAALYWVGLARIDFWALLSGYYWWLTVPVVVTAVAAVTVMQERATNLHEVE